MVDSSLVILDWGESNGNFFHEGRWRRWSRADGCRGAALSGVAGIGYRGLPFEAAGGVMDSGEWFEDGVSTPSLQSMSERSDSENQDCDTASNESRERPLNQGVDDVGEARAGFSVQGWRQAVNADGGMEWLAAWTGDWEGARKYYRWANEDLEDLADCWEELAAGYMRRKLGGGWIARARTERREPLLD